MYVPRVTDCVHEEPAYIPTPLMGDGRPSKRPCWGRRRAVAKPKLYDLEESSFNLLPLEVRKS